MAEQAIKVGERVLVKEGTAVVRYVGKVSWAKGTGTWYGLELLDAIGDHDGQFNGTRYFYSRPLRGIFVQRDKIRKVVRSRRTQSMAKVMDAVDPEDAVKKTHVRDWDNSTVCRWVSGLKGMSTDYVGQFRRKQVTGAGILKLGPFSLINDYQVYNEEDRTLLIQALKDLRKRDKDEPVEEKKVEDEAPKKHGRRASNFQPEASLQDWSVDEVMRFINGLGGKASEFGDTFRNNNIDGKKLSLITDEDLKDMNVPPGMRKKILNSLMMLVMEM